MDIYSQSQLVSHNQESNQFTPDKPIISRSVTISGSSEPKRYEIMLFSRVADKINQPDGHESVYNSNRRRNASQIDRIGLLIDSYA
jgi:hypothetical protein